MVVNINVNMNNNATADLELQMVNYQNLLERSLQYLCRIYDYLRKGEHFLHDFSVLFLLRTLPAIYSTSIPQTTGPELVHFFLFLLPDGRPRLFPLPRLTTYRVGVPSLLCDSPFQDSLTGMTVT